MTLIGHMICIISCFPLIISCYWVETCPMLTWAVIIFCHIILLKIEWSQMISGYYIFKVVFDSITIFYSFLMRAIISHKRSWWQKTAYTKSHAGVEKNIMEKVRLQVHKAISKAEEKISVMVDHIWSEKGLHHSY